MITNEVLLKAWVRRKMDLIGYLKTTCDPVDTARELVEAQDNIDRLKLELKKDTEWMEPSNT